MPSVDEVDLATVIASARAKRVALLEAETAEKGAKIRRSKAMLSEKITAAILEGESSVVVTEDVPKEVFQWLLEAGCTLKEQTHELSSSRSWRVALPK